MDFYEVSVPEVEIEIETEEEFIDACACCCGEKVGGGKGAN